jgi:hypothetical protein
VFELEVLQLVAAGEAEVLERPPVDAGREHHIDVGADAEATALSKEMQVEPLAAASRALGRWRRPSRRRRVVVRRRYPARERRTGLPATRSSAVGDDQEAA